jgi:tetratricopeptide (TPR) repeat protein
MSLTTLLMIGGLTHAFNWDKHSFSVIPLAAKALAGYTTAQDHKDLGDICKDRAKYECAAQQYQKVHLLDKNNLDILVEAGTLEAKAKKYDQAIATFAQYFKAGGKSPEASYQYALALGEKGKIKEAMKYFEMTIKAKPKVLQVTVARDYVDMLVKHNKLKVAKKKIRQFRRQNPSARYFMKDRMQTIQRKLASVKVVSR